MEDQYIDKKGNVIIRLGDLPGFGLDEFCEDGYTVYHAEELGSYYLLDKKGNKVLFNGLMPAPTFRTIYHVLWRVT